METASERYLCVIYLLAAHGCLPRGGWVCVMLRLSYTIPFRLS